MGWEWALALGFLLLFSAWVSFPSDNQYSYIDSTGIKHYILTPKISAYDNAVENWTNILFTRYDDPWTAYADTAVLVVAGIFTVMLMQQSFRLYLLRRMNTLFNFVIYLHQSFFATNKGVANFGSNNIDPFNINSKHLEPISIGSKGNNTFEHFSSLNHLSLKKLKFKKSFSINFLTIFSIVLLLNPFYAYPVFAPTDPENNSTLTGTTDNNVILLASLLNNTLNKSPKNSTDVENNLHDSSIHLLFSSSTSLTLNSTSNIPTNSTQSTVNGTSSYIPTNSTQSTVNSTSNIPTNSTSPSDEDEILGPVLEIIPSSSTLIQSENVTHYEDEYTDEDFITVTQTDLNEDLNKLTISAWVKPNYNEGSTEFAIVGKENSFLLSINNIIPPEKTAIFSVFDGMAWSSIMGSSPIIDGEWTHLVATVNGTQVNLYQNGVLQDSTSLHDVFSISEGNLNLESADIAGSDSDVIIGAYVETKRGEYKTTKQFSGTIENVLIFKNTLSQEEIYKIYLKGIPKFKPSKDGFKIAETALRQLISDRIQGIPRAEFNTIYANFSEKIDRKVFHSMADIEPFSAAQRFGITNQEKKMPVYIHLDSKESISRLPSNVKITGSDGNMAVARLSMNEMNELAKSNSVTKITLPDKAVPHGHGGSEGVAFSNADNFHNAAIDGTGVTVAVIDVDFLLDNPEIESNVISATLFDSAGNCLGIQLFTLVTFL